jgi:hypothetical protein
MKDFYDLQGLSRQFVFVGRSLLAAIQATFERRGTAITREVPAALTRSFYADPMRDGHWRAYFARSRLPGEIVPFGLVGERVASFLLPVWNGLASGTEFVQTWPPGGPWGPSAVGKEDGA